MVFAVLLVGLILVVFRPQFTRVVVAIDLFVVSLSLLIFLAVLLFTLCGLNEIASLLPVFFIL